MDNKELANVTFKDVLFSDFTVPTADSVVLVGPKTLEVSFSEPLHTAGTYTLDGGIYSATVSGFTPGNQKVRVQLGTTLSEGEHTLNIKNSTDYVGFKVTETELKFNYQKVTSFPNATVKASDEKSVTLSFDAPVYNFSKANFYHSFTGYKAQNIYLDGSTTPYTANAGLVSEANAAKEVKVVFAGDSTPNYPITGATTLVMEKKIGTNEVKDLWENKLASDLTLNVSASSDTVKPVVTEIKATAQNKVVVIFDKEVTTGTATNSSNYEIVDSKGKKVTGFVPAYNNDEKKVTLTFSSDLVAGDYSIKVKNIKDASLRGNTIDDVTKTISVADLKGPDATLALVQGNKVLVQFADESLLATSGQYSILERGNYQYDGKALPDAATLTIGNDGKSVIVDFTNTTTTPAANKGLDVSRVADVHGNKTTWFSKTLTTANASTNAPVVKFKDGAHTVEAINRTTVKFDVTQPLTGISASDFTVNTVTPASATYTNNSDGTATVTLVVADGSKWTSDATPAVKIIDANSMKNQLGTPFNTTGAGVDFKTAGVAAADKIAPSIAKDGDDKDIKTYDLNKNGKIDTIVVTYDEAINPNTISATTYTVEGYTVTGAFTASSLPSTIPSTSTAGKYVAITVTEKDTPDADVTPKVTQVVMIKDAKNNVLEAQASADSLDKAAPVLVSAKALNTKVVGKAATTLNKTGATDVAVTTDKLNSLHAGASGSNNVSVADGNVITIAGKLNGTAVTRDFAVTTANATTVQNLMTEIETTFGLAAGKVTLTAGVIGIDATDGKVVEGLNLTLSSGATNKSAFDTAFAAGNFDYSGVVEATFSENIRMRTATKSLAAFTASTGTLESTTDLAPNNNKVKVYYTVLPTLGSETLTGQAAGIEDVIAGVAVG